MKPKVIVAGVIVLIIIALFVTVVAATITLQGPAQPAQAVCNVTGYLANNYGTEIPDTVVTLHVMTNNTTDGNVSGIRELYTLTAITNRSNGSPGGFVFHDVVLIQGASYAYVTASIPVGNNMSSGVSKDFILKNNTTIDTRVIIIVPPEDANLPQSKYEQIGSCNLTGYATDTYGNGAPGALITYHAIGYNGSADEEIELRVIKKAL